MAFLKKHTLLWLVVINVALKIIFLDANAIANDEPFSIFHAQLDPGAIFDMLRSENNPPLHFLVLHYWIKLFGISAFSVRFPSLIFSCLTLIYLFNIGKTFFNYRIALLAGLLFTFSNYHLYFAHEARVYPLFAFLTTMSMYYFLRIGQQQHQKRLANFGLLLLANTLLFYAHYLGVFVILTQGLIVVFIRDYRQQIRHFVVYAMIQLALFLPCLLIFAQRLTHTSANVSWVEQPNGLNSIYNMLGHFCNKPVPTALVIILLVAALIKLLITKDFRKLTFVHQSVLWWFIFPFLTLFFVSFRFPLFVDRYLIFVSMPFFVLIACSAFYLIRQLKAGYVIPALMVFLFAGSFNPNKGNKRLVRETLRYIREVADPETRIVGCPSYFAYNYAYYAHPDLFRKARGAHADAQLLEDLKLEEVFLIKNIRDIDLSQSKRLIYLDAAADFSFPDNGILPELEQQFSLKKSRQFPDIFRVFIFERRDPEFKP